MSTIFITVGTTEFDGLIEAIDSEDFVACLKKCNFRHLNVQTGRGAYLPHILSKYQTSTDCGGANSDFKVNIFNFKPNLDADMKNADLIISHCGAGSILESITLRKALIVVINESLQDNHQKELSDALIEGNFCLSVRAKTKAIIEAVTQLHSTPLNNGIIKSFPINDGELFASVIQSMYDFE